MHEKTKTKQKKLVSNQMFNVNELNRVKWLSIFVAKEPIRRFVWIVTQHKMHPSQQFRNGHQDNRFYE